MINKALRYSLGSDLVIYALRCTIGFLIGYQLYLSLPEYELYWTVISIILVMSPEAIDARKLAVERLKANLIGCCVGLVCFFVPAPQVDIMVIGIIMAIAICHFFHLIGVARSAVVAFIIVVIHEQATLTYWAAIERFFSVTLGCLIGLGVTMATSTIIRYLRRKLGLEES